VLDVRYSKYLNKIVRAVDCGRVEEKAAVFGPGRLKGKKKDENPREV
jgi:hypothetical protein